MLVGFSAVIFTSHTNLSRLVQEGDYARKCQEDLSVFFFFPGNQPNPHNSITTYRHSDDLQ